MDKKELFKLKKMGFTYLVKMKGINSFRPIPGSLIEAKQIAASLSSCHNEVMSIDDAIALAEQGFEYEETICFDWMITKII